MMARTRAEKVAISEACDIDFNGSEQVVFDLLSLDRSFTRWLDKSTAGARFTVTERHHIYGRPLGRNDTTKNYRCNIIRLFSGVHGFDSVSPKKVELCCLWAQYQANQKHLQNVELGIEKELQSHEWCWNFPALNQICGYASLEGRIEVALMPVVVGTGLESIAVQLLQAVKEETKSLPF